MDLDWHSRFAKTPPMTRREELGDVLLYVEIFDATHIGLDENFSLDSWVQE